MAAYQMAMIKPRATFRKFETYFLLVKEYSFQTSEIQFQKDNYYQKIAFHQQIK